MTTSLGTELTNLGIDLDDATNAYWSTADLTLWINQACTEIARQAECLMDTYTLITAPNVSTYAAPIDCVRINSVYFSPNDPTQKYPVAYKGRQEMNAVWNVNQTSVNNYPNFYTTWQQPPYVQCQVFPVPSQPGILEFWYYRLPIPVQNSTDLIDLPDGYEDILRAYVRYCARRRAGDPIWQDDKNLFQEGLSTLITNSRNWTDQSNSISTGNSYVPGWLYGGGWG